MPGTIPVGNNQGLSLPTHEYVMQPLNSTNNENFIVAGGQANNPFMMRLPTNLPCQPYQTARQHAQGPPSDLWSHQFSNQNSFVCGRLPNGALMVRTHPSGVQTGTRPCQLMFQQPIQLNTNITNQIHSSGIWNASMQRLFEGRRDFPTLELGEPQINQQIEDQVVYEVKNEFPQRI